MIKKSTLFILLAAIALGAAVYFFDWKRGQKDEEKSAADSTKPAFSIPTGSEIVSLVLARPQMAGEPAIHFEKQNGFWQITAPLQTGAEQHALQTIVEGIGSAHIETTVPGTPDRLKVYGLDPPAISLDFKLKDGAQHSLKLGNKDFTNSSVYGIVDGGKDVALLPLALRTQSDLPIDDLRDHDVLHFVSTEVVSLALKNSAGEIELKKEKAGWTFAKPAAGSLADDSDVTALLNAVASAKMAAIVAESADNLGKYGLAAPAITFTQTDDKGQIASLLVGRKDGDGFFAKDSSRPLIFQINDSLQKKLATSYNGLRDKKLVHLTQSDFTRAEIHNANATVVVTPKSEQEWVAEAPPELKGKAVATWKIFTPITTARAEEIVDRPSANILAKLAKPLVQVTFTEKDGKNLTVSLTSAFGEFVYARTSDSPAVYKLKKNILDDLNSKPLDYTY
ncbi:MAG: DUF4340 domain-containing protein [Candidatus Acidiferrales bacterium]